MLADLEGDFTQGQFSKAQKAEWAWALGILVSDFWVADVPGMVRSGN